MKKIKERKIYFDMDGTIADLYSVNGWLDDLRAERTTPYQIAKPMYDMEKLNSLLETLKVFGYKIGIITWGSMDASDLFDNQIKRVKREWVKKNLPAIKEFHYQRYGTPKHRASYQNIRINHDILIDDNAEVRKNWERKGGIAINPTDTNLFVELSKLIS